jgi:hypothetical protein
MAANPFRLSRLAWTGISPASVPGCGTGCGSHVYPISPREGRLLPSVPSAALLLDCAASGRIPGEEHRLGSGPGQPSRQRSSQRSVPESDSHVLASSFRLCPVRLVPARHNPGWPVRRAIQRSVPESGTHVLASFRCAVCDWFRQGTIPDGPSGEPFSFQCQTVVRTSWPPFACAVRPGPARSPVARAGEPFSVQCQIVLRTSWPPFAALCAAGSRAGAPSRFRTGDPRDGEPLPGPGRLTG